MKTCDDCVKNNVFLCLAFLYKKPNFSTERDKKTSVTPGKYSCSCSKQILADASTGAKAIFVFIYPVFLFSRNNHMPARV